MGPKEIWYDGVNWIQQAQDRGQWRAVVCTVMNIRVPLQSGNFVTTIRSRERLCSLELVGRLVSNGCKICSTKMGKSEWLLRSDTEN